jgi:hypothetical protein
MKTESIITVGVLAGAAYLLYQLLQGTSKAVSTVTGAASTGYNAAVNAVSSGLYALFGPNDAKALGSMQYLLVNFSDGTRHAVPANTVDQDGFFIWTGYPPGSQPDTGMQLMKDANGAWYAF